MIGYANFRLWVPGGRRRGARCGDKRKDDRSFLPSFMWCHQESNRGHKDFQSFALPTELWHLALDCECKVIAFCRIYQIFSQLFFKNFNNWRKFAVHGAVDATGAYLWHAFGWRFRNPGTPHVATPPRGAAQHPVRGGCTATHHLRGAILLGDFVPRMSPRPRVAKYGATHGCHPLPGIEITSPLPCATSKPVPPQEGAKKACTGARLSYEKNLLIMNCYLIVLIALVVPSVKVVTTMFTPSNGLSERCPIMLTYSTDLTSFSTASSLNVPSTPVPSCAPLL